MSIQDQAISWHNICQRGDKGGRVCRIPCPIGQEFAACHGSERIWEEKGSAKTRGGGRESLLLDLEQKGEDELAAKG